MEENKNINPETQSEKVKDTKTKKKAKLLKNQALFKRGSYSVAITALVLAGIIILNVLLGALSDRFVLEFDISSQNINSISEENIEYIKSLNSNVDVIVCADREGYYQEYMAYYAQQYGVSENYADYYKQTISLIDKYNSYNDKINIRYIDTQKTEFAEITKKYSNENLAYGDIIVVANTGNNERYKVIGYQDIYELTQDDTYAAYGVTTTTVTGNNIETALTSAIAYVTSNAVKKVAFLVGHSKEDLTEDYRELLKTNNYEIDVIEDVLVNDISNEYDAVFIASPTIDFKETELDALSKFLDNDGKYNKGLLFFADATAPYLTNFYEFLEQWGIAVEEGVLFETNKSYHITDSPTTMISAVAGDNKITNGMQYSLTGFNVPFSIAFEEKDSMEVKTLFATSETVVNAPVGTSDDWKKADDYKKSSFPTVIQSQKISYDEDNNLLKSSVYAFSSHQFIYSEFNEYADVANKNITLAAAESAVRAEDTGISFVAKKISNESFADSVTESATAVVRIIFMILIPLAAVAIGLYVYIKRRNA